MTSLGLHTRPRHAWVRAAERSDVDALVRLRAAAARRAYAGLGADSLDRWLRKRATREHVANLLDRGDGQVFVACDADQLLGMAFVRTDGVDAVRLSDLYCDPPGMGAGSALLEARLAWARVRGLRLARCTVFAVNVEARWFFARRGFQVVGTEQSDAIPGALLLRHERALP